ncbi:hypothetical protein GRF59_14580 [Paenibacillus sp. HJL G12]|uniref:Uncharacterized protein n=1 Tax=Paenibacillus dendrobii TaxID=2691084 RepID=A0A7X3IJ14_9BACL|nr:hypothetical protein [Paenibacillus dendrobii]
MYQKPNCECGSDLVFTQEYFYREQFKISNEGHRVEKRLRKTVEDKYILEEYLRCPDCTTRYEFDYDNQGRIVLVGEIIGHLNGSDNVNTVKT